MVVAPAVSGKRNGVVSISVSTIILVQSIFLQQFMAVKVSPYLPYSSCHEADTSWRKGSGFRIRSWINSIVPQVSGDKINFQSSCKANFTSTTNKPYSLTNGKYHWLSYGEGPLDGWLYGELTSPWSGDQIAFIYPDFETALIGKFRDSTMIEARETKIKGYRCHSGILELQFNKVRANAAVYEFEEGSDTFFTNRPTLMDPYDKRHVYVAPSKIPAVQGQDGLFARRKIEPGQLVALYAGFRVFNESSLFTHNMTIDEREEAHKNLMSFTDDFSLNIPSEYSDIAKYRATLGHKSNHAFEKAQVNADFDFFRSPRFGWTRSLVSVNFIHKHEEILLDYDYSWDDPNLPRWYKEKMTQDAFLK